MPGLRKDSDDEEGPPAFPPSSSRRKGPRAITYGDEPDSPDSMPGLQSVSNTEEEEDEDDEDDDDDDNYSGSGDDVYDPDSSYDAENEDEIRGMVDEAKFFAREGDFFNAGDNIPSELDPFLQEDRKDNPFLKLLGSLRGLSHKNLGF